MLAEGTPFNTIKRRLQTSAPTIIRWKQRFLQSGLDGLDTYHPGQKATVLTPALRARILSATRKKPRDGSTHWSCRKLAATLSVSKDTVHRVLERSRPETPSPGALLGQRRSRVRKQSGRYSRSVPESAATRRGLLHRREDRDPGSGPARPRSAAVAGTRRASWVRVLPPWHAFALCRAGHQNRPGARKNL